MFESCFERVEAFKKKFPITVCWRLKRHSEIIEKHLNPNEQLLFAFAAQLNEGKWHLFDTAIIALTSERIMIGHKGLIYGYNYLTVTPDMYNDLKVRKNLIWSDVEIDTIKENVYISNLDPDGAIEIETKITEFMMKEKRKYVKKDN